MLDKKIVIAGGSIAGCVMGILLQRLGFQVDILERAATMKDGGAGITLPQSLVKQCINLDLLDADIPFFAAESRSFYIQNNTQPIWEQAVQAYALNWFEVYRNLLKRIHPNCYHTQCEIRAIEKTEPGYRLQTSQNKTFDADLLIAADGVDSFVRHTLLPQCKPNYAGYVGWRGLVAANQSIFDKHIPYCVFDTGHLLLYRIPTLDFKETGNFLINWVLYETCPNDDLERLLIDKFNVRHHRSLPAGTLTEQQVNYLHQLAADVLPESFANLVLQTPKPFIQAIFDFQLPGYNNLPVIFTGDAALTLRPHTASGVTRAIISGIEFSKFLTENHGLSFNELATSWQKRQQAVAKDEIFIAQHMGDALVTHPPKWETMNPQTMDSWWASVLQGRNWYLTQVDKQQRRS